MPPPAARPDRLLGKPFRASSAVSNGIITRAQLKGAGWRRLFRDVYVSASAKDGHLVRVEGAALILPSGSAISGRSAALLWGAKMGDELDVVEVRTPLRFGPVTGLKITTGALPTEHVTTRWGIPVCTVAHTAWEIARSLPEMDAVAWVDALAKARNTSRAQLIAHGELHRGEPGSVRASGVLRLCDPRAESPPESHLRVHLHKAGFPRPVPQYQIVVDRVFLARVDLAWPALKLAVEYDGQWHGYGNQLTRDRERYRDLNRAGWYVYPVTRADMCDIEALLADLATVMAKRIRAVERRAARHA